MRTRGQLHTVTQNFRFKLLLTSLAAVVLTACGGTGQDDGQVSATQQQFGGRVIDGYLARSTVFIDANNNGTRDAWEAFAFTDNEGYYSYNPETETDYCAATATPQQAQYCLVTPVEYTNAVVRVDGGYDVLTGEPFLGQMSRRYVADVDERHGAVVSPLTSLLTSIDAAEQQNAVLQSMGLEAADLDVDYLNVDGSGAIDAELLNASLTIHKVVTVLSDRLTDTYTEIGDNFGTPNDATSAVYPALAEMVQRVGFDAALSEQGLHQVLDTAESQLREVYSQRDFTLPADMGSAGRPGQFARVAEIVSDIAPVVDSLIDPLNATTTVTDVAGKARALESLVLKAVNENNNADSSIANVVDFFTNSENEPLIGALVDSLSAETADLSSLSKNDFSGDDFDSVLEISQSASVPEGVEPFRNIGGTTLRISDLDLGTPEALDDSEIEFYFDGAAGATEGSFGACVKLITDAKSDGTLGDNNSRGEVATGYWSMFGAIDGGSYSVLVTIEFLGTTYQGMIKAVGAELIDGVSYQAIRFDNDGKLETWHTLNGFVAGSSAALTNAECEARLPSRVGL